MKDHQLLALGLVLAGSVALNFLIHWTLICPHLYKRGARFPTGFLFWRLFRELGRYADLRKARAKSLDAYYAVYILTWFNVLLLVALLFRAFYDYSSWGP